MHEMRHGISEKHSCEDTSDVIIPVHCGLSFRFGSLERNLDMADKRSPVRSDCAQESRIPDETRCRRLDNIEAHHHIVVFMFEVVAMHQVATPIAVESHDHPDVVA
jgi:hypothetical protein